MRGCGVRIEISDSQIYNSRKRIRNFAHRMPHTIVFSLRTFYIQFNITIVLHQLFLLWRL